MALVLAGGIMVAVPVDPDPASAALSWPSGVDMELTAGGTGFWVLDDYGRVQPFGTARYLGGAPALAADESAVSLSSTPSGSGYWIFTSKGRVFPYGDAGYFGDVPSVLPPGAQLNGPILATVATPSGLGYYMLGSDGGMFTFGDARYWGSIQEIVNLLFGPGYPASAWLNGSIVGLAPTTTGLGYWLVASDGGMFTFGDATYHGSAPAVLPGVSLNEPIVGMVPQGNGYLLVAADGGIFNFGDSDFHGSIPALGSANVGASAVLPAGGGISSVMVSPSGDGYSMLGRDGVIWPFGSFATRFAGVTNASLTLPSFPGDTKDCSDFEIQPQAQRWYDTYISFYGDPANLDPDGDRIPCEALPADYPSITAGTHLVGSEVAPGTYRTRGNNAGCNWERLSGLSGNISDVLASDYTGVSAIVTIGSSDVAFSTNAACGTWTMDLSPITASPGADFGGGTYQVGVDIAPGTWMSTGGTGCAWSRLSGFTGTASDTVKSGLTNTPAILTIASGDVGFASTAACGTWRKDPPPLTASPTADFGGGAYRVGVDIASGMWRTRTNLAGCSWQRLAGFTGTAGDVIANDFISVSAIVTLGSGDAGFGTNSACGTWTRDLSPITASATADFSGGTYQVGVDIASGMWRTRTNQASCSWQRLAGFSREVGDAISSEFTSVSTVVTIDPDDVGFTTNTACTWTRDLSPITASTTADFSGGTYQVGVDIAPGTWRTRTNESGCKWQRRAGFSGELGDVIGSDFTSVSAIVTIDPGDVGFTTNTVCTWTRDLSPITASTTADFSGGTYQVGVDIAAGTWTSSGGAGCSWQRLAGFSGSFTDIIDSDYTSSPAVVTIDSTDAGFRVDERCGTWTKTG